MSKDKSAKNKSQSEQQNAEQESDQKESVEETLLGMIPEMFSQTWLTSMLLHTALIIILAIITLAQIEDKTIDLALSESPAVDSFIETPLDLDVLEVPLEETELEMTEMTDTLSDAMEMSEVAVESFEATSLISESDFGDFSAAEDMGEALGIGDEAMSDPASQSTFFTGTKAKKIVYVVDNSNSMVGNNANSLGRMETALVELAKSVQSLDSSQEFYIVFYSDTAYGLFHPQTKTNYIRATYENKQRVIAWLDTIECCLKTNGTKAFEVARVLKPELIYVLGDGGFTDAAHKTVIDNPIKGAVINTLGMNLSGQSAERFRAIAEKHGGTYRDVGITKEGLKILRQVGQRPKHNKRGYVWGLTLPVAPKKKKNN